MIILHMTYIAKTCPCAAKVQRFEPYSIFRRMVYFTGVMVYIDTVSKYSSCLLVHT